MNLLSTTPPIAVDDAGDFPIWMKLEQSVGFVLLAAVAALLPRRVTASTV